MSRDHRLALLRLDPRDSIGDEQAPAPESDLIAALIASNVVALSGRMARLEQQEREDRAAINRILTRFATMGQPIPPEAA